MPIFSNFEKSLSFAQKSLKKNARRLEKIIFIFRCVSFCGGLRRFLRRFHQYQLTFTPDAAVVRLISLVIVHYVTSRKFESGLKNWLLMIANIEKTMRTHPVRFFPNMDLSPDCRPEAPFKSDIYIIEAILSIVC